jgi:hypothetical protein
LYDYALVLRSGGGVAERSEEPRRSELRAKHAAIEDIKGMIQSSQIMETSSTTPETTAEESPVITIVRDVVSVAIVALQIYAIVWWYSQGTPSETYINSDANW